MSPITQATIAVTDAPDKTSITTALRSSFSVLHLFSAASFSRATAAIEGENSGQSFGQFWEHILAYATAAVLTSVAALEAYANELFVDPPKIFPDLRVEVMACLWELYEQKRPLEKFELALLLKQADPFDRGAAPYQDVAALIKLRNALTHFKPEWENEQVEHAKVSAVLAGRFDPSPFLGPTEPLFPKRWATHGCTVWAVRSVVKFINEFDQRAGLPSLLTPFAERLNAL